MMTLPHLSRLCLSTIPKALSRLALIAPHWSPRDLPPGSPRGRLTCNLRLRHLHSHRDQTHLRHLTRRIHLRQLCRPACAFQLPLGLCPDLTKTKAQTTSLALLPLQPSPPCRINKPRACGARTLSSRPLRLQRTAAPRCETLSQNHPRTSQSHRSRSATRSSNSRSC